MNKKLIGILIIVIGLIFLVGIIYFTFFFNPAEPSDEAGASGNRGGLPGASRAVDLPEKRRIVIDAGEQPAAYTQKEIREEDLKRLAVSFTERFGSYSNQSNYGNIGDLKIFMDAKMRAWADDFVSEAKKNNTGGVYYSVITKAISSTINNFDDDSGIAEISVKTKRREVRGASDDTSNFYQDLSIRFVKEKEVWKINEAVWGEKR